MAATPGYRADAATSTKHVGDGHHGTDTLPAALGKYANSVSTAGQSAAQKHEAKRLRYALRSDLWDLSTIERCRKCGKTPVGEQGTVGLRVTADSGSGFSGLASCGSVWVCPVCAAKVSRRRADEVAQAVQAAADRGYSASLLTLTARHHRGQRLKWVWNAVLKAWRSMLGGRFAQTFREVLGVKHWVRVVEVTHGDNGWHPHLHVILIHDGRQTAEQLESALWPRWFRALERQGMTAVQGAGLDVRSSSDAVGEYLVKSLAAEVTAGHAKQGRAGGRTPFQILRSVTETGDADDLALWHEWEAASRGRRQIGWSKGFRDWARLAPEQSDEQIAEEEPGGDDVLVLDAVAWRQVRREQGALLVEADKFGVPGARAWLRRAGVHWREVKVVRQ